MALRNVSMNPGADIRGAQIHWNSILSCTFLMLGFGIFFLLLGNAIGLNIGNLMKPTAGGALKVFSWVYVAFTLISSYFLGANLGTKIPGINTAGSGSLHGMIAWGLTNVIGLTLGAITSIGFRDMVTGFGPNYGNWLALGIVGVGLLASAVGGAFDRELEARTPLSEGKLDATGRRIA